MSSFLSVLGLLVLCCVQTCNAQMAALNTFLQAVGYPLAKCPTATANEKACRSCLVCGTSPGGGPIDQILEIRLPNLGLNGTLPNMSAFVSLQKLFVNNNNLRGTVNLAGLEDTLEQINLGANDFTGKLPNMSKFSKIEWIFFGNNNWTGSLDAIGDLRALTALQALSLNSNLQLFGTFPRVPTSLTQLAISGTNMSGNTIPSSLASLVRLTSLRLSLTGLVGPVPSLAAMTNLTDLRLDGAGLTGTIMLPASQLSRFSSASCVLTSSSPLERNCFTCPNSTQCVCTQRMCVPTTILPTSNRPTSLSTTAATTTATDVTTDASTSTATSSPTSPSISSPTTTGSTTATETSGRAISGAPATTPSSTGGIGAIVGGSLAALAVCVVLISGLLWWRSKKKTAAPVPVPSKPPQVVEGASTGVYGAIALPISVDGDGDRNTYSSTLLARSNVQSQYEACDSPLN
jgi:hypothetical protein